MPDLNALFDELSDSIAAKVVERLRSEGIVGNPWPNIKPQSPATSITSTTPGTPYIIYNPVQESFTSAVVPANDIQKAMGVESKETPADLMRDEEAIAEVDKIQLRREELMATDLRKLKRDMALVEQKNITDYEGVKKHVLVEDIIKLELILGRTIQDQNVNDGTIDTIPDDEDLSEEEPNDDTEVGVLTREVAETLDLELLKNEAARRGATTEELKGLDVEEVVDILFGPVEPAGDDPEASEEDEDITEEELRAMSIGELKDVADQLREQGAEISYTRTTSRDKLLKDILDLFVEEEEE